METNIVLYTTGFVALRLAIVAGVAGALLLAVRRSSSLPAARRQVGRRV